MGNSEWERGEFTLPSAEFARVRQAVQAADKAHKELAFAKTQEIWKGLSRKEQTDPAAYRQALSRIEQERWNSEPRYSPGMRLPYRSSAQIVQDMKDEDARKAAMEKMQDKCGWRPTDKPSRVLQSDMDYPTSRTTVFGAADCAVSFDPERRAVTWGVSDGKNSREIAHGTHVAGAFFGALRDVKWTYGTGGVIVGNDEANRFDREQGGGQNYVTGAYGYIGIDRAPGHVSPFTNARGQRVTAEMKTTRTGKAVVSGGPQGRVTRGVPTGGQFAGRQRSQADIGGIDMGGGW